MQNRYVGDAGDFGKYGLLRHLIGHSIDSEARLRLAVIWCLVPDETHNNDGKHVAYLRIGAQSLDAFRVCDPDLYDRLRLLVPHRRSVAEVRAAGILPEGTAWFDHPIGGPGLPAGRAMRQAWHESALSATREAEVVFLDPDNGLRADAPNGRSSYKHIHLDELRDYQRRGQSLVIYHHLDRSASHPVQVRKWRDRLDRKLDVNGTIGLRYCKGSSRAFFVLPAAAHRMILRQRVDRLLASSWSRELGAFEEIAQQ